MILLSCIAGITFGLLRGGRLQNIAKVHFSCWVVLFLSLGCEGLRAARWVQGRLVNADDQLTVRLALALTQYLLVAVFLYVNRQKSGLSAVLGGSALNGMVIIANGGRMPIGSAIKRYGETPVARISNAPHYFLAEGHEPLLFLGDIIPLYPYMISIGDILIALGMFWLGTGLTKAKTNPCSVEKVEQIADFRYTDGR